MSYFMMNSGQCIELSDINPEHINIKDIAHHLTKIQRYGGALPFGVHYSVAQHSIKMAEYVYRMCGNISGSLVRATLLHDASEAYLGDVNSHLKKELPDYKKIEERVQELINLKYNAFYEDVIKSIDRLIVLDEAGIFFPDRYSVFRQQYESDEHELGLNLVNEYGKEDETYYLFLYWCKKLGIED